AAALLHKAIGSQLTCIFVNNGVLRAREAEVVQEVFGKHFRMKLKYVDASKRFLSKLRGVTDPERKRKIIGGEFIRVFDDAVIELTKELRNPNSAIQIPRARHALPGCDRVRAHCRQSGGDDQEPSQRRRPAEENEAATGRA